MMADKTDYQRYQDELRAREWKLSDVPFYREGEAPDFTDYETLDYLDFYHKVWGRQCGENGLGRLREVAISLITEAENAVYEPRYPFHEDLIWLESQGLRRADIQKLQDEQGAYAEILEANGVKVHWIVWGEQPMTPFGPDAGNVGAIGPVGHSWRIDHPEAGLAPVQFWPFRVSRPLGAAPSGDSHPLHVDRQGGAGTGDDHVVLPRTFG